MEKVYATTTTKDCMLRKIYGIEVSSVCIATGCDMLAVCKYCWFASWKKAWPIGVTWFGGNVVDLG